MKQDIFYRVISIFILAVVLLIMSSAFIGCNPAKIAQKAVEDYQRSPKFPQDCATQFPPIITGGETIIDTVKGEEVDCDEVIRFYNEFWEGVSAENEKERKALADTIAAMLARGEKPPSKKVRCPPSIYVTRTDTIENRAEIEAANRRYNVLSSTYTADTARRNAQEKMLSVKLSKAKKWRNYSFGLNFLLLAVIGGGLYLKSRKGLIKKVMS